MSNLLQNIGELPINEDNEALIIANAIKNKSHRKIFLAKINFLDFRKNEFKQIAFAVKQIEEAGIDMNVDALLLKCKTTPVKTLIDYEFISLILQNFDEVSEVNFEAHLERLRTDSIKAKTAEYIFQTLYAVVLDPNKDISIIKDKLNYLSQNIITIDTAVGDWSKAKTLKQIFEAEYPPTNYIVPQLIPSGLSILYGQPKIGKSFFLLELATKLATGGLLFNSIKLENKTKSLYIALEDNDKRLKRRMIKQGTPPEAMENVEVIYHIPENVDGIRYLAEYMRTHTSTGLIMIDTIGKFTQIENGNDYHEVTRIMSVIKRIADDYNVAIVIVHHAGKADTDDFTKAALGSTAFTGVSDTSLHLTRKRNQNKACLNIVGRDIEGLELALEFNPDYCRWAIIGNATEIALSQERQVILELLAKNKVPMTPKEIADVLDEDRGTIKVRLSRMFINEQLDRDEKGYYSIKYVSK
jgi:hypothetical protein